MRVLVSGVTGFIGRHVVSKLTEKYEVLGVSRRKSDISESTCCDLGNISQIRNLLGKLEIEVVVHAAASANLEIGTVGAAYLNNVLSTLNLLTASIEHGVKKIIFLSSNMVYGSNYAVFLENLACSNPQNWYSKSKLICEKMLHDHSDQITTVCLRLPSVLGWGKGTSDVVHDMIHELLTKKKITIFGDGLSRRQFIHIDDLTNIIGQLIDGNAPASVIPVVHSELLQIDVIAKKIISYCGYGTLTYDRTRKSVPDQYVTAELVEIIQKPTISLDLYLEDLKDRNLI
jgi:nucleoside-diphosphate-sugar epimerase